MTKTGISIWVRDISIWGANSPLPTVTVTFRYCKDELHGMSLKKDSLKIQALGHEIGQITQHIDNFIANIN